jgi:hypothetical protein
MIKLSRNKLDHQLIAVIGDQETARQLANGETLILSYAKEAVSSGNVIAPRDERGRFIWSLLEECDFAIRRVEF